jgi:cell division protein FtsI/penicillin-binding protein 2
MTRYFFVILLMALIGVAIVVKAGITMFAERQYWQDVADRFVKENVTVKPNRGNIISSDGKLMASSLPEYRIYMDFMSGEKDEKRRRKDQARRDSILNANMDSICIGLHKIFPDKTKADEAKARLIELQMNGELQQIMGQLDINKAEAASGNAYASSWRPTIGYICAFGLAYNFIIYPTLGWYAATYMPGFVPPPLLSDNLMELVMGMLGLAGLRTMEKIKIGG